MAENTIGELNDFLEKNRVLMAPKIEDYYFFLQGAGYWLKIIS